MIYKCNFLAFVLLLFMSNSMVGQKSHKVIDQSILGSLHMANYFDNNAFTPHEFTLGVALQYRKNIDSLSHNFHLSYGVGVESVPVKVEAPYDGYYINTHFNFTNSIGLYYTLPHSYYLGLYSSLDIPFANRQKSDFNGSTYENFEFYFQYLNINFSAGLNLGRIITIKERQLIVELHFKALGLLGLKSNDYWHYPDGGIPYYSGVRIGYGF